MESKKCCRCDLDLPITDFYRKGISGRMSFCKKCDAKRQGRELKSKPIVQFTVEQLSYLGGLVDGEGHIGMAARKRKTGKYVDNGLVHVRMVIGITAIEIFEIKEWFGIGKIYTSKPKNKKHKTRFDWTIRSNEIKMLLPQLIPFLRIKKKQAELLMEYYSVPRTKDENYRSKVKEIYKQIKALNTRGREEPELEW